MIESGLPRLPDIVQSVTSMLSYEERALLFELARRRDGSGVVVDAGCFLGGSTVAFGAGITAGKTEIPGVIHTYDFLRVEPKYTEGYSPDIDALKTGTSLRPFFERNVAQYRNLITLHEGDVLEQTWHGAAIDILFLDICKTWEVNAHVLREWFPSLVPMTSVVVQQDLVHWAFPWCTIVMEMLIDHFEYLGWTWYASSVWRCVSELRAVDVAIDWQHDIGLSEGLELLRRSAVRHGGRAVPIIELCRSTLMHEFGDDEAAVAEVDRVEREFGTAVPHIDEAYKAIRGTCTSTVN
jgi:hypothetical protein